MDGRWPERYVKAMAALHPVARMACLAAVITTLAAGAEAPLAGEAQHFDAERCPLPLQLRALGSVASAAGTWKALHVHYQTYGQCDAGPVREGYAHGVVSLLASRWEHLPELARHAKEDPGFLDFVVLHVDATSAPEDLEAVRRSAKDACPRAHRALCRRLEAQADAVLHSREVAREGR